GKEGPHTHNQKKHHHTGNEPPLFLTFHGNSSFPYPAPIPGRGLAPSSRRQGVFWGFLSQMYNKNHDKSMGFMHILCFWGGNAKAKGLHQRLPACGSWQKSLIFD